MAELFLDIETEGLKKEEHRITCIGVYHTGVGVRIFTHKEERVLLEDFFMFLQKNFFSEDLFVTFNGTSFDLPFILERSKNFQIDTGSWPMVFESKKNHLDLMVLVSKKHQEYMESTLRTGRVSKAQVLGWFNIYEPRVGNAANCVLVAKTSKDWTSILQHNAEDLFSTGKIYKRCIKMGWIK